MNKIRKIILISGKLQSGEEDEYETGPKMVRLVLKQWNRLGTVAQEFRIQRTMYGGGNVCIRSLPSGLRSLRRRGGGQTVGTRGGG